MPDKHRIPTNLTPTGDIVVPLSIPHDPQWTGLLLGVLITLEETEYYQKDPDFDNEDAKVVAARWRDTTLNPLIEAIATGQACGGGIVFNHVFLTKNIGSNFTVTSSAFSIVTGSNISFTPSRANFKVTAHNTLMQNSNNSGITYIQVRFEGVESGNQGIAANTGTNFGSHDCVAIYEGVSVGVAHDISIYAKRETANGLIARANDIIYEIEEWD